MIGHQGQVTNEKLPLHSFFDNFNIITTHYTLNTVFHDINESSTASKKENFKCMMERINIQEGRRI